MKVLLLQETWEGGEGMGGEGTGGEGRGGEGGREGGREGRDDCYTYGTIIFK